jgi:hypothetical protein
MDITLDDDRFCSFVDRHFAGLATAAASVCGSDDPDCLTASVLHDLYSSSSELEEILDACGAGRNRRWYPLRRLAATIKLFSQVGFKLEHMLRFLPAYRLPALEHDFVAATREARGRICSILRRSLAALLAAAGDLGLGTPAGPVPPPAAEEVPAGRLPADRSSPKLASPEATVARVATAFLNLAEDGKFIHVTHDSKPDRFADWIPEPISEAHLRAVEQGFHNLQSLYDTHISDTNVESLDPDLPVLRGHISVIFHLLETATALAHYCERHILSFVRPRETAAVPPDPAPDAPIVDPVEVLGVLMGYSLAFASRYMVAARSLCHEMLRRYAIQGHITVPVPRYRGFHVRPSTLVARIVVHYGSQVTMKLESEAYNAGFTLDLFRANEKITAVKRRLLAREVYACLPGGTAGRPAGAHPGPTAGHTPGGPTRAHADDPAAVSAMAATQPDPAALVRDVAHELFTRNKLVLYERNLAVEAIAPHDDEALPEFVLRALTQLLSTGKIDMEMDVTVTFVGDRRVLEDIKLLAENGYGEDDFGNNLPLPEELAYLRK